MITAPSCLRTRTELFVCSRNRLDSPTARHVFSLRKDPEVSSAGTKLAGAKSMTAALIDWVDLIFVIKEAHRSRLQQWFRADYDGRCVICHDIPDNHALLPPELNRVPETNVSSNLPAIPVTQDVEA